LGVRVFDTQCGAKLFSVTPQLPRYFSKPFLTRWIFDVEILARMQQSHRAAGTPLEQTVYEYPLDAWRDVAGSSLKKGDFVKAVGELVRIYWTYLGPAARPDDGAWTPSGRLLPDASGKSTRGDQRAA